MLEKNCCGEAAHALHYLAHQYMAYLIFTTVSIIFVINITC